MDKYLEEGDLSVEELKAGIRAMTISSQAYPVFCGTAFKNKGIQPVLNGVIDYLPSPLDVPDMVGHKPGDESTELTRAADWDEPFSGLAFKVAAHPFFGSLTYVRVYSGQVQQGMQILNATTGKKERVGKLFQMHSNKENPVEEAFAGHIYAFIGLKDTTTGDTLTDSANPIQLESMSFPDPVISVAIEPKTKSDQEKLGVGHPEARQGGSDLPGGARRGDRPDRHQGHGRAAPRRPRGSHEARVQRRGQHRQAAGGLPRDDQARGGQVRLHPQEADRRLRPVREGPDHLRPADRCRGRRVSTSSRTRSPAAASRASTSRAWTRASRMPSRAASSPATRS